MKTIIAIVFVLFFPLSLHADESLLRELDNAQRFIKQNPVNVNKDKQVDESGLVELWQQVEPLHNMSLLYFENDLPARFRFEVNERISTNRMQTRNMLFHDDPVVRSLAALIKLHADIATSYLGKHVGQSDYSAVAAYVKTHGRWLAQAVEKKYSKGKKILREPQPAKPW